MPLFATIDPIDPIGPIDPIEDQPYIFSTNQIEAIQGLNLPPTLIFKTARSFDTKRIITRPNLWEYNFSGSDKRIEFKGSLEEIKIKKYIIASLSLIHI